MTRNLSYVDHRNEQGVRTQCRNCKEPLLRECTMKVKTEGLEKVATGYLLCKCGFAFYKALLGTKTIEDKPDDEES